MSEPKLISPLLDGFAMGNPMSNHDGVRCCPAMRENSDDKYIVKIISIPASQVQLEALLLTGAYADPAAAMDYFKELADGVIKEAETLQKLSRLEGFLPYDSWQIVPMENNHLGYDVYLISPYKQSLEKYMRKNLMTHLGAVNLGLDLCAALAICRKSGNMYVDLKPTNIFISEDKEYRIGDLGFVELASLKYAALPTKYHSSYTAPELNDAMATLNTTADIYSVGLILYQIYNNGKLPFEGSAPAEVFPTPENADYEIAEIILKACDPNPDNRWQDPIEMGQALVAYMQRNSINDTPITPPTVAVSAAIAPVDEENDAELPTGEEASGTEEAVQPEELSFLTGMVTDETAPGEDDASETDEKEMSEEVSSILTQANELIDHETPEPVIAPEPIDVPFPAPIQENEKDEEEEDFSEFLNSGDNTIIQEDDADDYAEDDEEDEEGIYPEKKKKKGWIAGVIVILILALLGVGGFYFYQNYYLMPIESIELDGFENELTVILDTEIDNTLLTVICTDTYGNSKTSPVTDGKAVFTDLLPGTLYNIKVEISGFHKVDGPSEHSYSTPNQTNIVSFTAVTGNADGSVVLNFTVDGPGTEDWIVNYSTEGEEAQSVSFSGHMVTINDLTVGKIYHFELLPATELYMVGQNTLQFTASSIIVAENLKVTAFAEGTLTAQWTVPEGASVSSWTAHCYSDDGYSKTIETSDTVANFSNIDLTKAYTIEVTASGMTQSARTNVTANPITITAVSASSEEVDKLTVSWEFDGTAPDGGWLLMYTIDGSETQEVVKSDGASAVIENPIPGATYNFTIQAADSSSVFGGSYSYDCPNAEKFTDYEIVVSRMIINMCKTPEKENWTYRDVNKNNYTTTFAAGDKISLVLKSSGHYIPADDVTILYVIRDAEDNVISSLVSSEVKDWYQMWNYTYPHATLNIPAIPTEPGEYSLYLYFNNGAVSVLKFTVTE